MMSHRLRAPPSIKVGRLLINQLTKHKRAISSASFLSGRVSVQVPEKQKQSGIGAYRLSSTASLREKGLMDDQDFLVFDTLHELQKNACVAYENNKVFGTYRADESGGGEFVWQTYGEFSEKVGRCRSVLKDLGVEPQSKVGIISNNRWEWAAVATASFSLSAVPVPMYEAQLASDWKYILNDSEASVVFCATQDIYDQIKEEVLPSTPLVKAALCFDAQEGEAHAFSTAMSNATNDESIIVKPTPDDLANLIYTSGTTGKPKGVELTHGNFVSNVQAATRSHVKDPHDFIRMTDRSLAFLPWAHSYGQTCELWCGLQAGASYGVCRGVPSILEDLQLVKPTVLFAVPTLYKRIYDGVQNLMESSSSLKKGLMEKALTLGAKKVYADRGVGENLGMIERMQLRMLDKIILSKIRDRFGGNLRQGFVAGAACPSEVLDFMDSLGIPIYEGYGLSETSPIISINTPDCRSVGSVGKAINNVEVFIIGDDGLPVSHGEEGEICCVGPNVMRGYYKNKEATDEVISTGPDGKSRMFHTGDLGRMSEEGFVSVTGRLKEQYKLENGKYIVPTPIEEAIGMSRFINQVVLCGANRPHNVALLVPDWSAIRTSLEVGEEVSEEDLVNDERVKSLIDSELQKTCTNLKKFEVPNAWAFVAPFTAANNMLTPKMSIRRHKVIKTYEDLIGHLYGDDPMITESTDGGPHKEHVAA